MTFILRPGELEEALNIDIETVDFVDVLAVVEVPMCEDVLDVGMVVVRLGKLLEKEEVVPKSLELGIGLGDVLDGTVLPNDMVSMGALDPEETAEVETVLE